MEIQWNKNNSRQQTGHIYITRISSRCISLSWINPFTSLQISSLSGFSPPFKSQWHFISHSHIRGFTQSWHCGEYKKSHKSSGSIVYWWRTYPNVTTILQCCIIGCLLCYVLHLNTILKTQYLNCFFFNILFFFSHPILMKCQPVPDPDNALLLYGYKQIYFKW